LDAGRELEALFYLPQRIYIPMPVEQEPGTASQPVYILGRRRGLNKCSKYFNQDNWYTV